MNDKLRERSVAARHLLLQIVILSLALPVVVQLGCIRRFGTGGTGELVIPREFLREIRPTDLSAATIAPPTTQDPTTLPSTRPATRHAAQIAVTIEEVRRLALQ